MFEIIIAMAILATLMMAAYESVMGVLDSDIRSRFERMAPMLAHQKMEALYGAQPTSTQVLKGGFRAPYVDYTWNASVSSVTKWGKTDGLSLLRYDLTIRHNSLSLIYTLRTYRKPIITLKG